MQRKLILVSVIIGGSMLLTACGYNPLTATPTPVQQCNSIKRQILFQDENTNINTNYLRDQQKRERLNRDFNQMQCYTVLQEAKHPKPAKTQNAHIQVIEQQPKNSTNR